MKLRQDTEKALDLCYDAILAPELWSDGLHRLAQSLGAAGCSFHPHDPDTPLSHLPQSPGMAALNEIWGRVSDSISDHYSERAGPLVKAGYRALTEELISTADERRTSPYYQEVARPANADWWAGVCFSVDSRFWCLPVWRGADRGPFTRDEAVYLAAVGSHLGRLISLAEKFAATAPNSSIAAFDQVAVPAFLLDRAGIVVRSNRTGQALLGDHLKLAGRRLLATDRQSNARLQRLISRACVHAGGEPIPAVIVRDERPWLFAESMTVDSLRSDVFNAGVAIIVFTDLSRPSLVSREFLSLAFGMTAAESRVAALVAEGNELPLAARRLGISHETARTQLKAVFAKTGVRNQAQLAALVTRLRPMRLDG